MYNITLFHFGYNIQTQLKNAEEWYIASLYSILGLKNAEEWCITSLYSILGIIFKLSSKIFI